MTKKNEIQKPTAFSLKRETVRSMVVRTGARAGVCQGTLCSHGTNGCKNSGHATE